MDMSVKLNLSYTAPRQPEQATDKSATPVVPAANEAAVPVEGKASEVDQVKTAVKDIEKFLASNRRNLEFSTDEESGRIVVKVIASETGELVRQIPSEEVLRIAHSLSDVNSLLFNAKV